MIKFKGMDKVNKFVKQFPSLVETKITQAIWRTGLRVEGDAKKQAPYETGTLRRSINTQKPVKSGKMIKGKVGTNITYAPHQEYGTKRGIRPKRYLSGAVEMNRGFFSDEMKRAAQDIGEMSMR